MTRTVPAALVTPALVLAVSIAAGAPAHEVHSVDCREVPARFAPEIRAPRSSCARMADRRHPDLWVLRAWGAEAFAEALVVVAPPGQLLEAGSDDAVLEALRAVHSPVLRHGYDRQPAIALGDGRATASLMRGFGAMPWHCLSHVRHWRPGAGGYARRGVFSYCEPGGEHFSEEEMRTGLARVTFDP